MARLPVDVDEPLTLVVPDWLVTPTDELLDAAEEAEPVPLTEPRTLAPAPTDSGPEPTAVVAVLFAAAWA